MTYAREQTCPLPEHVGVSPDQLQPNALPQIKQLEFFNGIMGVRSGADNLRPSIVAASAADITKQELQSCIGAAVGSRLGTVVEGAYQKLGMTSPENEGKMVARAWQRRILHTEQDIWLPGLEISEAELFTPPLVGILKALSCEVSVKDIQAAPEFTGIPVDETLATFQSVLGLRTIAGAISFGFMTGRIRPISQTRSMGPSMTVSPDDTLSARRSAATQTKIIDLPSVPEPESASPRRESRPPQNPKQRFNIPSYMRVIEPNYSRPKGETWPERLEPPELEGQYIHWGGGVFKSAFPGEENLDLRQSRALVLSCFDQSIEELVGKHGLTTYESIHTGLRDARAKHHLPNRLARVVEAMFSQKMLVVIKYMPEPTNTFYSDSLRLLQALPSAASRNDVTDRIGVDASNSSNVFKKAYQSFAVASSRGLLTRAYGLGIWIPPIEPEES